jgi:hypothetical protein
MRGAATVLSFVVGGLCTHAVVFKNRLGRTSAVRTLKMSSTSTAQGLSPLKTEGLDYATISKRANTLFRDMADSDTKPVVLVPKSDFQRWKAQTVSNATEAFMELMGVSLKAFPGSKTLMLPDEERKAVTAYGFYDDASKSDYKVSSPAQGTDGCTTLPRPTPVSSGV